MSEPAAFEITKVNRAGADTAIRSDGLELDRLRMFSARIGRDPLLVQASTGNTSLKLDGTLWIKASGTWLANADQREIFVPMRLSVCLDCFKKGTCLPPDCESGFPADLRPSIETFMHAVLPHRVIVHVHSVTTLAWAVRSDAPTKLSERLSGLRWRWIPYVCSGVALAREIQTASATCSPQPDVFVLGNHGLVVCGESCEAAGLLLDEVQRRLAIKLRPHRKRLFRINETILGPSSWRLPPSEVLHTLGTDLASRRIIERGVLYPCQAVFLGCTPTFLPRFENTSDLMARLHQLDPSCPFVVLEDTGVLIKKNITAGEYAVLNGFAEVVRRIEPSTPLRYLTDSEVNSAVSADGHRYRMSAENDAPC